MSLDKGIARFLSQCGLQMTDARAKSELLCVQSHHVQLIDTECRGCWTHSLAQLTNHSDEAINQQLISRTLLVSYAGVERARGELS